MSKKVVFKGIEILTNESDSSVRTLLGVVESVIDRLESDLDRTDENFHVLINMDFKPDQPVKHSLSFTSLSSNGTRGKIMSILKNSVDVRENKILGTVRVDLKVEDRG